MSLKVRTKKSSKHKSLALMVAAAGLGAAPMGLPRAALAADEAAPAAQSQVDDSARNEPAEAAPKVEKIQVTGSHIKRVDVEGIAPVTTISRRQLDESGSNSVADVLRDTTANSFGSLREKSGSNAAGVAHIDLRGLGSSSTLVLLNGNRLPTDAVTGAVDLNLIPMAAVERIEVLKDGASALYGSDALGGVVNIITRKDFSGTEVGFTQQMTEAKGGAKTEVSAVNGINTENVNVVNVVQYRDNKVVYSRDREWTSVGLSTIGGPGTYKSGTNPWTPDANCPAGMASASSPQGSFCQFKFSDYSTELPALQQLSLMSEANIRLTPDVKLTTRLNGTQRKAQWSFAPAPGNFVIPGAVADTLGPGGGPLPGTTPGEDLRVRYRLTELGTRDTEVSSIGYGALVGTEVQLPASMQLNASASHNAVRSSDKGVSGYALTKSLTDAIESGQYNPFGAPGAKGSLEHTRYAPEEKTTSLISSADAKVSGEIAELPAGPVGVALGVGVTHQSYKDEFDDASVNGEVFGNAGSSGGGQRSTQAVFTELNLPILPKTELQLAARHDRYSDFGSTTNPKAGFSFRGIPSTLIRGSVGTGFKAPLMQDLYAATGQGFPTFVDAVACRNEQALGGATPSCNPAQYEVTSSGNTGLKEEKSVSYNLGVMVEPVRNLSLGADWYRTLLRNKVGIDYNDLTQAELNGVDPAQYGVIVGRDGDGYLTSIEAPLQNLSAQEISGIDLSANYKLSDVRMGYTHSQVFWFMEEGFPGTGSRNKIGENGRPRWRGVTSLGYAPGDKHDLSMAISTIAGQAKAVASEGNLNNYSTVDLAYAYKSRNWGTISLGVRNVLGTKPPIDDSVPADKLNTELYDQLGRSFLVGYKKGF